MSDLVTPSHLFTPETLLRMAERDNQELRRKLVQLVKALQEAERALDSTGRILSAVIVQAGGTVTVTQEELAAEYEVEARTDPKTKALTFHTKRKPHLIVTEN